MKYSHRSASNALISVLKPTLEIAVGLLVVGIVFCVTANVFGRFVLNYSFTWAVELARVLFIWLVLLGAGLGSLKNEHVAVTLFKDIAPAPIKKALGIVSALIIYAVCICILIGFKELLSGFISVTPMLKIPKETLYIAMPVMAILTLIANTLALVRLFKGNPS